MISDNQMISGRQASWIFMLDMLAAGLFSLTAAKEQASSLTMLVGSLLTIGLVLIYYKASFCMFYQYEKNHYAGHAGGRGSRDQDFRTG